MAAGGRLAEDLVVQVQRLGQQQPGLGDGLPLALPVGLGDGDGLGQVDGVRLAAEPADEDVDLAGLTSMSIWCDRFDVSFGAATLAPPA